MSIDLEPPGHVPSRGFGGAGGMFGRWARGGGEPMIIGHPRAGCRNDLHWRKELALARGCGGVHAG